MNLSQQLATAYGFMIPEEIKYLKTLVKAVPGKDIRIINIGAGIGTATLAMLECRPDSYVFTVDIQDSPHPLGSLAAERMHVQQVGYLDRLEQVLGDSIEVGMSYTGPDFDAILVDGWHSYEHASGDILTWIPHVKAGGLIMVHDYGEGNGMWDLVKKAVDEHLAGYKRLGLVNCLIAFENTLE